MNLRPLLRIGLCVCAFATIAAQFIEADVPYKCPENWIRHENSCYRFIKSPIRPRADAQRNCQAYDAELVSVNSMDEHRFIVQELQWQDPQHRRWYTSGKQQSPNYWINEADGSSFNELNAIFLPENQRDIGILNRDYLAYSFTNRWGLEKVTGDEHLTYICEASLFKLAHLVAEERSFAYGSDIEDPEKIPRGPYFTRQPHDVVYDTQSAKDTKDVTMTCRAGGYPAPTYEWFREEYEADKKIAKRIDPLTNKRYTLSGGSLIINNPKEETDRGLYYCKATNEFGSIVSEIVQLNFGFIGEFNLNRQGEQGLQNWGKALNCDPPHFFPEVKYYWSRPRFPDLVEEDARVFVSHDGALYFSALEPIDAGDYSCNVHSSEALDSTMGRNGPIFHLSVNPSSNAQQLQIANTFPKVFPGAPIAGRDARLECFAFAYPIPSYNWTRRNAPLPKNHRVENYGRVLIIPSIRMEDQGEYVCRMTNDNSVKEGSIILSVQAEPNFTIPLVDRHVDIHSDLTWTCEAFGNPDVTYRWFRNGEPLIVNASNELASRYSIQDNILTIKYLDKDKDPAMYQCQAINALKMRYSSAQLRVLAMKPTFKRRPLDPEIYAAEGRKITIFCNPEAAPKPKFSWKKDGYTIGTGGPRTIIEGNLTINPVSRADAGVFTCLAENNYGGDTSSTKLTVLRLPYFVETLPAKMTLIVGQNLELRCLVNSEDRLDVAYIWTHNGLKLHSVVQMYSSLIVNSGLLTIYNVTFASAGEYECIAKTGVGSVESRVTIYVEGPPSSPGGLLVSDVVKKDVKLQWTDGSANGRPIVYYIVSARTSWDKEWTNLTTIANMDRTRKSDLFSERKEASIEDVVIPWSQYEFRLQAVNEIGISQPSAPSPKANIPPDRPYVAPANVSGGGGKIGDLTITWMPLPPWQQNGPGIRYKVFWRRREEEKEFQSKVLDPSTKPGVAIVPIAREYYYIEFIVKVQAINNVGSGPESPVATIFSAEDIPHIQPQSITATRFNSTALNASWTPIPLTRENIRGKLIGYRLKYWKGDSSEDTAVYYLSRSIKPWALIVGLQPNTTYYVKVMAFNGAGAGPESERILERTFHKAPQQPPTSVFVKGVNPSTIKVVWRYVSPNRDEEPLTGYKVRVWPMGEDISRARDTIILIGNKLEAIVTELSPGKRYNIRVLAFSNGGDGRMSSPTIQIQMGREEAFTNSAYWKTSGLSIVLSLIHIVYNIAKNKRLL